MANVVELSNGRVWKSQDAAKKHFREIRDRYPDDTIIDNTVDHEDLVALLERHDAAHHEEQSKIAPGIDYFEVRTNFGSGGPTRGFWVIRTDGSATDFSFPWAIRGIPKPEAQEFADACRAAVDQDLKAAKRRFFETYGDADRRVPCELTGHSLSFEDAHLDHAYPPFGALVIAFRAARGWHGAVPSGIVTRAADRQLTSTFASADVADAFRAFHHAAAMLRMVSSRSNLSRAAGQRRPRIARPVVIEMSG